MTKHDLVSFEFGIAEEWNKGNIPYPVHLSGGNEDELIKIFKDIKYDDWVFSTHRNHYHYLLKGGDPSKLYKMIMRGDSMHVMDKQLNFFSTGIVAGNCAIAAGVAESIAEHNKTEGILHYDRRHVWCFVGDGATDEGHFWEAINYAESNDLPITFIIEDNDRSVCSNKKSRGMRAIYAGNKAIRYYYVPTYPHVGTGKKVQFKDMGEVGITL